MDVPTKLPSSLNERTFTTSLFASYLKVRIGHTSRDLLEERLLDFLELRRLDDVEDLLDFTQEHDLI